MSIRFTHTHAASSNRACEITKLVECSVLTAFGWSTPVQWPSWWPVVTKTGTSWMSLLSLKRWIKCKAMMGICIYWSCRHFIFVKRCNYLFNLTVGNLTNVWSLLMLGNPPLFLLNSIYNAHHGSSQMTWWASYWSDAKDRIKHVLIMGWACFLWWSM